MSGLAVTWWGHSTTTVELGATRVLTDPVLTDRFAHLVRRAPSPAPAAAVADLVVVSHLHLDHFHARSLRRLAPGTAVIVPETGAAFLRGTALDLYEARPGDVLEVAGARVEVLAADHPATRHRWTRKAAPPLGFRIGAAGRTVWFPGDTGPRTDVAGVAAVDLALVPVGGWGPTLGPDHVDPAQAAALVERVGARWALPVHWGTFWPIGMGRLAPLVRQRLFETPGERFAEALAPSGITAVVAAHGRRVELEG